MTYLQLLKLIENMTEDQKKMQVITLIDNDYNVLNQMLHVDKDFREENEDDLPVFAEDQPILT